MKTTIRSFIGICIIVLTITLKSCGKDKHCDLAVVETLNISDISQTTVKSGGFIISDGGCEIVSRGVCWSNDPNPDTSNFKTMDGRGVGSYVSNLEGLQPGTTYYIRSYAINDAGVFYGNEKRFIAGQLDNSNEGQIIADHTIVDRFDDIPEEYIEKVKRMWLVFPGESHSYAYKIGLDSLEARYPKYQVTTKYGGTPTPSIETSLRASRGTWGDVDNVSGWIYGYGEEDWYTSSIAITNTKAGITYCNTHGLTIDAIGFVWCSDLTKGARTSGMDPVYSVHWYGRSIGGPEGNLPVGIDNGDFSLTGNTVCVDTYLDATQQYIEYCKTNSYPTNVFFTTGPVNLSSGWQGESGYQGHIKYEYIRNYVRADPARILFDYADILCYDDNGVQTTQIWNGHTFPSITLTNGSVEETGHISFSGSIRLAKALWWMLARMAGWDGE